MREVVLCNLSSISRDYNHVLDFETKRQRDNFFNTFGQITYKDAPLKNDGSRETVTLPCNINTLKNVNYLFIKNNNDTHFYFITNKTHLTDSLTELDVELDVWTTYMFDYEILPSYVDRCHQDRWDKNGLPIINTVDEGLPLGEYIQDSKEDLYTYNNGVIITTTQPLGEMPKYVAEDGGGGDGTNGKEDLIIGGINVGQRPSTEVNLPTYDEDGNLIVGGGDIEGGQDIFISTNGTEYEGVKLSSIPTTNNLDWIKVTDGYDNYYSYANDELPQCIKGGLNAYFCITNISHCYDLILSTRNRTKGLWTNGLMYSDSHIDELLPYFEYIALGKVGNKVNIYFYGTNKEVRYRNVGRIKEVV